MSKKQPDVKIVFLGDSNVGKTSVLTRYLSDEFGHSKSTIGASFFEKDVKAKNGSVVSMGIWDTAGAERYHSLSNFYCRGAHCAIIVYDMTDKSSFDNVRNWVDKLYSSIPDEQCFILLVGNKLDLTISKEEFKRREVKEAAGKSLAEEINAIAHMETSAKTKHNITEIFETIVEGVVKRGSNSTTTKDSTVELKKDKKRNGGCCI